MPETTTEVIKPKEFKFKMGADPELILFYSNRRIHAQKFLDPIFRKLQLQKAPLNEKGQDLGYIITDGKGRVFGETGWDNHKETAEIRPAAEKDPIKLTENIGNLVKAIIDNSPQIDVSVLSIGEAIGGHIHVEIPKEITNTIDHELQSLGQANVRHKTITIMGRIMSSFLLPIIASEHKISAAVRKNNGGGYGGIDDYRMEQRGPNKNWVLEIRGLTAEWMLSPKLTKATLVYIGVVWNEILKNKTELAKNRYILKTASQTKAVQEMIMADYGPIRDAAITGITKLIKTFELYEENKEDIDFILNINKVTKEKEKKGWNVNVGWEFTEKKEPRKQDLLSNKILEQSLEKVNRDLIEMQDFSIAYNNDYNVQNFQRAIIERILALGWTLKNEYFLFGLKKGIEGYLAYGEKFLNDSYLKLPTKNAEKDKLINTALNMDKRSQQQYGGTQTASISPKTGKIKTGAKRIMIGIPYDVRTNNNIKTIIELIWDIENNKIKEVGINSMKNEKETTSDQEIKNALMGNDTTINLPPELQPERLDQPLTFKVDWGNTGIETFDDDEDEDEDEQN